MTATALQTPSRAHSSPIDRSRALGRLKFGDNGFRLLTLGSAVLVLALLLGVVGLYGVVAYSVSQRRREIDLSFGLTRGATTEQPIIQIGLMS